MVPSRGGVEQQHILAFAEGKSCSSVCRHLVAYVLGRPSRPRPCELQASVSGVGGDLGSTTGGAGIAGLLPEVPGMAFFDHDAVDGYPAPRPV